MRYLFALLIVVAVALAVDPIGKNENNILYSWPGLDFEVYQANAGIGGYRETAAGADTVFVAFDLSSATYDHGELYIQFTADRADGLAGEGTVRNVAIYWLQALAYSARTVTAGNKLSLVDMNTEGGTTEYAYRTITPDSASYANKVMIDNIAGEYGESTGVIGPFWIDADAAADSTCAGFVMITADTVGVSWRALLISRT
jgi:hypothetical protein